MKTRFINIYESLRPVVGQKYLHFSGAYAEVIEVKKVEAGWVFYTGTNHNAPDHSYQMMMSMFQDDSFPLEKSIVLKAILGFVKNESYAVAIRTCEVLKEYGIDWPELDSISKSAKIFDH